MNRKEKTELCAAGREFWLYYDDQIGRWLVQEEPFKVIRTGAEVIHAREAARPQSAAVRDDWQPMETAPLDGRHCILAVKTGAFIYSIQGAFMKGKWMNAADIDGEPLAWMPNIRLPDEFCPWTDEYKFRAATKLGEVAGKVEQ